MTTITPEQEQAIRELLDQVPHLAKGLGTVDEPCSVAAINLALGRGLTDSIPDCMSRVIGKWVIAVQDAMPQEMRDSAEWRDGLVAAAGTGRDPEREQERLDVILDWMWTVVLPVVQPVADRHGFGAEWRSMCEQRTEEAASATHAAASAAHAAAYAAYAADAASATHAASSAAHAAAYAAYAADAASATHAASSDAYAAVWETFDPPALLARHVTVGEQP